MEFHEKLQQLRKKNNLTQEQLAQKLFVSRTAVSKWESGRGYPGLDSLKGISKLFSVSIDGLLSNDELIELAETEKREKVNQVSALVFAVLDLIAISFSVLPLFGRQEGAEIRAVALWEYAASGHWLPILYWAALIALLALGVVGMIAAVSSHEKGMRRVKPCSIVLHAAAVLLFSVSRQPYMTVFLFLLFMVKVVLLMQENRSKG